MVRKAVVAVIGSGDASEGAVGEARRVGELIAANGWVLLSGGRDAGVMAAANEGAKSAGGTTIGILPDRETPVSHAVDVAVVTGMGEARNNVIVLSADAVIACGVEDPGTASEVALAIKASKPVVFLDADPPASAFFGGMDAADVQMADSAEEAIRMIIKRLPARPPL